MIIGAIALIMILFGGGSGPLSGVVPKDVQKRMEQAIAEPARSERAVAEWNGLQKDIEGFGKELLGLAKRVKEADDPRGTGVAQLEPLIGGFESTRRASQEKVLDRILAIRKDMTREEWAAVFGDSAGTGAK